LRDNGDNPHGEREEESKKGRKKEKRHMSKVQGTINHLYQQNKQRLASYCFLLAKRVNQ